MRCIARTKSGRQCKNHASGKAEYCAIHRREHKEDALRKQFYALLPVALRLSETLEQQLEKLLDSHELTLGVPIERRVKKWDSIQDKLERRKLRISSLKELSDFVGLRLILLFKRDLEGVHSVLTNTFDVISHEDTSKRLKEMQFGYQSVHYIVKVPLDWLSVPTMTEFRDFKAEVQVRTLAQHIWAAASHKLQYKHETSVPLPVRRSIHRVSAILETVDLELERVLTDRGDYLENISADTAEDTTLNVDVLRQALGDSWPSENLGKSEPYAELLGELNNSGINTVSELKSLIDKRKKSILRGEEKIVVELRRQIDARKEPKGTTEERVLRGVFYTHVGLTRMALIK